MGFGEKALEWLKENAALTQRVNQLTDETRALGHRVQNINDRLIRVETVLRMSEIFGSGKSGSGPPLLKG